jgi:hypothetical protein
VAYAQIRLFEHGEHQFIGSARVGGGFQDQQHSGMNMFRDLLIRIDDVTHVRIFGFTKGRRHGDVNGVEEATAPKSAAARSLPDSTIASAGRAVRPGYRIRRD